MSQPCVNCGFQNPADSVFCVRCGKNVKDAAGTTGNFGAAGASSFASQGYQVQSMQQVQSRVTFSSPPEQMGSTSGGIAGSTTPHAFAGKGDFFTFYRWFLPGDHLKAASLRAAVLDLLLLRHFRHLTISSAKLRENGHWFEEREYIIMRRGVATCFVYVAPAGQDLHISRTITVQLSFDPIRIVIFACILAEVFLGPVIISGIVASAMGSAAGNPASALGPILIAGFLVLLSPLCLFILLVFTVASIKYWFAERDFWVYLRRNYLHDFELDDVSLLADATYETVLAATKQVGGDVTKITLPTQNDQQKRRVRLI